MSLGKNMSNVKIDNKKTIISYIYLNGPTSRKNLSDVMGITQAAISKICKELIESNILYEMGSKESISAGRKEIFLQINYKQAFIIGINLFKDKIVSIITYSNGEFFDRIETELDNENIKDEIINIINLTMYRFNLDNILGIGISCRGKTNPIKGYMETLDGEVINIVDEVEKMFNIKTYVNNNVRNIMIQELNKTSVTQDTLFVKLGPGLGCGVFINGNIVNGENLKAGEFGKIKLDNGESLEEFIKEKRIINDIKFNFIGKRIGNYEIDDYFYNEKFFDILNSKEPNFIKDFVLDKLRVLIRYIYIADNLIDFKHITFYGRIFEQINFFDDIRELISNEYESLSRKLRKSCLDYKNEEFSPIYLVIDNLYINL